MFICIFCNKLKSRHAIEAKWAEPRDFAPIEALASDKVTEVQKKNKRSGSMLGLHLAMPNTGDSDDEIRPIDFSSPNFEGDEPDTDAGFTLNRPLRTPLQSPSRKYDELPIKLGKAFKSSDSSSSDPGRPHSKDSSGESIQEKATEKERAASSGSPRKEGTDRSAAWRQPLSMGSRTFLFSLITIIN